MQAQMLNMYSYSPATLTLIDGKHQKKRYVLSPKTITIIGRTQNCQVVINGTQYPTVSRHHAEIRWSNLSGKSGWQILDAGATNGTFVNGQRINGYHFLKSGDHLMLGYEGPKLIFECELLEETFVDNIPSAQTINQATAPNRITQEEVKSYSLTAGNQSIKKSSNSQSFGNQPIKEKEETSEEFITIKSRNLNLIFKLLKWGTDKLTGPLIITGIGILFTGHVISELEAGEARRKNLTDYFNTMKELAVTNQINRGRLGDLIQFKRSRTFWILRELDGKGKGLIIRFLSEFKLIQEDYCLSPSQTVLSLSGADLREIVLSDAWLPCIDLQGAYIQGANLERSNLRSADLRSIRLGTPPGLLKEDLWSKLIQLNFFKKNQKTNFKEVDLLGANLDGAHLIEAKNLTPSQIKSACYWETAIYKGHWNDEQKKWVIDEEANEQYIDQLKEDKASEPKEPVDCSRWE